MNQRRPGVASHLGDGPFDAPENQGKLRSKESGLGGRASRVYGCFRFALGFLDALRIFGADVRGGELLCAVDLLWRVRGRPV